MKELCASHQHRNGPCACNEPSLLFLSARWLTKNKSNREQKYRQASYSMLWLRAIAELGARQDFELRRSRRHRLWIEC